MSSIQTEPDYLKASFNCPHCHAFSAMSWLVLMIPPRTPIDFASAQCQSCRKRSIWQTFTYEGMLNMSIETLTNGKMVYPTVATALAAHPMMPGEIKKDFEEARQIAGMSPRAAAGLLRLCIEKLCRLLTGEEKLKIDQQIAKLVAQGLSVKIQRALDSVRVIGNEAVHPGTIDIEDSEKYVYPLFKIVNLIVEELIATPAEIDDLFNSLPEGKLEGIKQRDTPKTGGKSVPQCE